MGSSDAEKSEEFKSPYSIVITKKKKIKKKCQMFMARGGE